MTTCKNKKRIILRVKWWHLILRYFVFVQRTSLWWPEWIPEGREAVKNLDKLYSCCEAGQSPMYIGPTLLTFSFIFSKMAFSFSWRRTIEWTTWPTGHCPLVWYPSHSAAGFIKLQAGCFDKTTSKTEDYELNSIIFLLVIQISDVVQVHQCDD